MLLLVLYKRLLCLSDDWFENCKADHSSYKINIPNIACQIYQFVCFFVPPPLIACICCVLQALSPLDNISLRSLYFKHSKEYQPRISIRLKCSLLNLIKFFYIISNFGIFWIFCFQAQWQSVYCI